MRQPWKELRNSISGRGRKKHKGPEVGLLVLTNCKNLVNETSLTRRVTFVRVREVNRNLFFIVCMLWCLFSLMMSNGKGFQHGRRTQSDVCLSGARV